MTGEKQKVAFSSVIAAIFLTVIKIVVGIFTGSLGILSEAAHSALDLGAAVITFFAVRFSDKPADEKHNYGHGKIESFSALIETMLLLVTCGWIIYEASERLFFGKSIKVTGTFWGIGIMVLSIIINISRARALKKVAKKYGSQALEADALHFDSDVWSSCVVIGGLVCVWLGKLLKIPLLDYGDPIAAFGVSILVIVVSIQLGKRTIDVLLDTAPKGMLNDIENEVKAIEGVLDVANIRIRPSGPIYFIDLGVGIARNESHRVIHSISHEIREKLSAKIPNCDVVISTYPVDLSGMEDKEVYHTVKKIVDRFPNCTNIHNIHVYEVSGEKFISTHIEVREVMDLNESHELSHRIGKLIQDAIGDVKDVSVTFEYVKQNHIIAEDITEKSREIINTIEKQVNKNPEQLYCHDTRVYKRDGRNTIFVHCALSENYTTEKVENISKSISDTIKSCISNVENIHIHVEPAEDKG